LEQWRCPTVIGRYKPDPVNTETIKNQPPDVNIRDCIFFENDDFIIARKPGGLVSEEDPVGSKNLRYMLYRYVRETYPWKKRAICQLAHRLDKPVAGLIICAKKPSILKNLQQQFYHREVKKHYLAVIAGVPEVKAATLRQFIKKSQSEFRALPATELEADAREAILNYRVLAENESHSLLQVELMTGKFHQIRFQLSYMGWPIWNDEWYSGKKVNNENRIGLYSFAVAFSDPKTGEPREFISCPPLDQQPWDLFGDAIELAIANFKF
jgi:23S rRNA pseudouridine1911/1915/1917 synthase